MSDGFTFKMNFGPNLLSSYSQGVQARLQTVVKKNALTIEAKTKTSPNMPIDTGNLRDSIRAEATKEANTWEISDETEYGVYQELGTSRGIQAHHFLGGACEEQADKFFEDVKAALK
jgi:hypothetical protein